MKPILDTSFSKPWYAILTGSDWVKFSSPTGVDGLCREVDGNLHILAVSAREEGKGHFREFIKLCKREYPEIRIYEIWNLWLDQALARYGFLDFEEVTQDGEHVRGKVWKKGRDCHAV